MEWSRGLTSQSRAPENERFDSASENTRRAPRSSGARGRDVRARGQWAVTPRRRPSAVARRGKPGVRAAETRSRASGPERPGRARVCFPVPTPPLPAQSRSQQDMIAPLGRESTARSPRGDPARAAPSGGGLGGAATHRRPGAPSHFPSSHSFFLPCIQSDTVW